MMVWIYETESWTFLYFFTVSIFATPKEAIHTESECDKRGKKICFCKEKTLSHIEQKKKTTKQTNKQTN